MSTNVAPLYPVNLSLAGRRVLLVGGGVIASHKAVALAEAGARITVVAPLVSDALRLLAERVELREFQEADVDGVSFVVSAAPADVNRTASLAGHARGLFVLAVDQPADASAQSPALIRRGKLLLTISTDGAAPALSGLVREALDALLPDDETVSAWLELASRAREAWKRDVLPHAQRRPLLLAALNSLYAGARAQ
ncbi:MAG: bifunctional precorrin-2 dehydrogenase/sirohydrochlorin ferrochelatase [Polyangia bacterium]